MGCKMLGIVNLTSESPALIVGGMERKRKKSPMVAINLCGVKTFNKNIFFKTPVQTLLFCVFHGWNQREFFFAQGSTNSTKQGQQQLNIFALVIKGQADCGVSAASSVEHTPTAAEDS